MRLFAAALLVSVAARAQSDRSISAGVLGGVPILDAFHAVQFP
jgi:hypothetical protein